jgi:hypothetical protein
VRRFIRCVEDRHAGVGVDDSFREQKLERVLLHLPWDLTIEFLRVAAGWPCTPKTVSESCHASRSTKAEMNRSTSSVGT